MRVLLQAHGVAEGFATDVAGEGPGPAVGAADVHLEAVWGGEHLGGGAEREVAGGCRGGGSWDTGPAPAQLQPRMGSQGEHRPASSAGVSCYPGKGSFTLRGVGSGRPPVALSQGEQPRG